MEHTTNMLLASSGENMQLKMGDNWRLLGDTKINNNYEHKSRGLI